MITLNATELAVVEPLTFGDALTRVLSSKGVKKTKAAEMVGISPQSFNKVVKPDANPSVGNALKYLAPHGYTIAVVPADCALPDGSYFLKSGKEGE